MNRSKNSHAGMSCRLIVGSLFAITTMVSATHAQSSRIVDLEKATTLNGEITTGKLRVYENQAAKTGRRINLNFVVLNAKDKNPRPDPFFFFVGGPGQAATTTRSQWSNHWIREKRDIVLIDQRGTAGDHDLSFEFKTDGNTLQQFLAPVMDFETVRSNLERLKRKADLRMYSTAMAVDDVNGLREALGYDKINIMGGSYGTRFCLVYVRRHGETVRTATLAGCAPIEFRNPLYHAEGAQRAIDMMFKEVESNESYRKQFGDLRKKFAEILMRLDEQPVTVEIQNQSTGKTETVKMDHAAFVSAVRFQMYYTAGSRQLPRLLFDAHKGDFRPFVISALRQSMGLRQSLALGMLLSVTAAEDVARIDPSEVELLTKNSFIGGARVRDQMKAAALWPKSELPEGFGDPVRSDVPTLILSGTIDPVTPPKWGEMIHKNFPNSRHLIIPRAHDIGGPCVDQIRKQFLETGTVKGLNVDCISKMKLPSLSSPK